MQFLTKFALRNSAAIIMISILIALGGVVAALSLKVESDPNVNFGAVIITTSYPNASPEDVLEDVTKPLEKEISSTPGMKTLESTSSDNFSTLVATVDTGADADKVRDDIEKKVNDVKLPTDVDRPKVQSISTSDQPMYYLAISNANQTMSDDSFNELVKDTIVEELKGIDGIEKIQATGDFVKKVKIYPKLDAMNTYGISPSELKQLISSNHVASPVGTMNKDGEDEIVRVLGEYTNIEQIKRTKLFLPTGPSGGLNYVQLGDIADVSLYADKNSLSRLNNKPGIGASLFKTVDANAVETGKRINQKLDELRQRYPDLQFVPVWDSASEIQKSIQGMVKEGLMGAVMASLMILVFLRHLKSTLIVLVSIPMSILVSMIFMTWAGITLNMMSLFGMAIAVGRVVDDSIVVIENIFRHLQTSKERDKGVIFYAAKEVTNAITSSTLTTVAVFVPLMFVSGVVGAYFRPFSVTVVCALLASLLVAVTVVPLMAKLMILHSHMKEHKPGKLTNVYKSFLIKSLNHKFVVLLLAFVLFAGSIGLAASLNKSFLPDSDTKMLMINLKMPKGTSLAVTQETVVKMEGVFMKEPKLEYVQSNIGSGDEQKKQTNTANLIVKLKSDADIDATLLRYRQQTAPLVPVDGEITINKPEAGGNGGYQVILNGPDLDNLKQASETVKKKLKENTLMTNIKDNLSDTKDQVLIRVDRDKAAEWKLSPLQVAGEVSNLLANAKIGKIKLDGNDYDLVMGLSDNEANSVDKLKDLWIKSPLGIQVRLSDLAEVDAEGAPAQIMQKDQKQYIQVTADITSSDKGGVSQAETVVLQKLKLPQGVTLSTEGIQQDMQKSFMEMFYAIGAAVLMVYIVMVIAFGNATAPLAILISLPLAAIGGLCGLFITRTALDVTSLIGFLMLIGIVVTNAIVYVDRVQQQRELGLSTREALIEAGVTRVRPILMTAVATIMALLPLGLGLSEGTLMSKGLSIVVIGGLLTSTLLTLVVVPVGYEVLDRVRDRVLGRMNKRAKQQKSQAHENALDLK